MCCQNCLHILNKLYIYKQTNNLLLSNTCNNWGVWKLIHPYHVYITRYTLPPYKQFKILIVGTQTINTSNWCMNWRWSRNRMNCLSSSIPKLSSRGCISRPNNFLSTSGWSKLYHRSHKLHQNYHQHPKN